MRMGRPDRSDGPLPGRRAGDPPARPARALPDPPAAVQQRQPAVPFAHPRPHRSGAPQPAADVAVARLRRHSHHRRDVRGGAHRGARFALARHPAHQLGPHHHALLHPRVHRGHGRAPGRDGTAVAGAPRSLRRGAARRRSGCSTCSTSTTVAARSCSPRGPTIAPGSPRCWGPPGSGCSAAASSATSSTRGGVTGSGWRPRWGSRPTASW